MQKKIVLVANSAFTLINFRYELIQSLVGAGHQVYVICPPTCKLTSGDVSSQFQELGVQFMPVSFQRNSMNPFSDLKLFFELLICFRRVKPHVIINYTIKPFIYSSIAAKLVSKTKITIASNVTGLGYIFTDNSLKVILIRKIIKLQLSIATRFNDLIFFQNPDDKSDYIHNEIISLKTKTKIIDGSGVNLNKFYYSPKAKTESVTFLFVARLLKDKGVYEFVAAAKKVKILNPNTRFVVVGPLDSNPTGITKAEIESFHSKGIIEYRGASENVVPHLIECDVFVLPSYREGTPRTILEAMAIGRPIITTDAPGCKECIEDSYNGYLVPVRSIEHLSDAMLRLANNSLLRAEMGYKSRLIATNKYNVDLIVKEVRNALGI